MNFSEFNSSLTSNCTSACVYDVGYVEVTEEEPITTSICFSNTVAINLSSFTTVSAVALAEAATVKKNKKRQ